jgi:predicted MPP superfamily phosphohydrolase
VSSSRFDGPCGSPGRQQYAPDRQRIRAVFPSLPPAFDGYRIAQLSDVHAAVFGKDNAAFLGAVKNARPDIIVITGDLINYDDEAAHSLGIVRPLVRQLADIAPVYYVTGNHEWDADWLRELLKALDDEGSGFEKRIRAPDKRRRVMYWPGWRTPTAPET